MKIWNIQIGEPRAFLRGKGNPSRVGRAHALSLLFARNGHEVTHFVSSFNHQKREFENQPYNTSLSTIHPQVNYVMLKSSGYKKNVSIKRIIDHIYCAFSFSKYIRRSDVEKPDFIVASVPTIELAFLAVRFAKRNGLNIVIDFRDLWPEIFLHHFLPNSPRTVAFFTRLLPWFWMNKYIFRNAFMVTTVGNGFSSYVKDRYLFKADKPIVQTIFQAQRSLSSSERPCRQGGPTRFIWAGNIVKETDFVTLKKGIEILSQRQLNFEIWIAGSGQVLVDEAKFFEKYKRHIRLLGWLNEYELINALNDCDVGLLCYLDRIDFRMAIQNKVVDYLRSGLPIIGSLCGELCDLDQTESSNVYHLYEFSNPFSLVEVMERFIIAGVTDEERDQCRQLYEKYFRLEVVERQWLSVLSSSVDGNQ